MLAGFRRGNRFRIAIAMATLAVFAFVAPPAAVAFAPTPGTTYCLTHSDHGMGLAHHDQSIADHHSGASVNSKFSHEEGDRKYNCCGLFCVVALAPEIRGMPAPLLIQLEQSSVTVPGFHSRMPEPHFRPPISRLSI